MLDAEEILRLIKNSEENELVDFKQEYYSKETRIDLIKDVCAFTNSESVENKYIIFGIIDKTHEICGVQGNIEDVSIINQILESYVEPFIKVSAGMLEIEGKNIGYIKIFDNNNKPYVLKKEYGNGGILKKGDIYIRKGATSFRALRSDLDFMYSKRFRKEVSLCDDYLFIGPVKNNSFEAGKIQVQFINESDMSIMFKWGYVTIENQFGKINKMIFNMEGIPRLDENPYELKAKTQKAENFFFEFESSDCIRLNFDEDGNMNYPTKAKVTFIDLEDNEYSCTSIKINLCARGSVLHKIKRKFERFRIFLKNEQKNLLNYINQRDKEKLCEVLNKQDSYFELVQPPYYFGNSDFPEYQSTYDLIKCALHNGEEIVKLFQQQGLNEDFIDICRARNKN